MEFPLRPANLGLFGELIRKSLGRETENTSASRPLQMGTARSSLVTPRPVTELASSMKFSDNGGCYDREGETAILDCNGVETHVATAMGKVEPRQFGLAIIENAIVCGEGIIWKKTPAGNYAVAETLEHARSCRSIAPLVRGDSDSLYVRDDLRPAATHDQTYVFLRQIADNNYGHWVTEALPKVAVVEDHYDIGRLKFIVSRQIFGRPSWPMRRIYLDSLATCGIKPHQIVPMGRRPAEIKRLIYPLPLALHPMVKAPRTIEILEGIRDRLVRTDKTPRRIYVSRGKTKTRRLLNEAEILKILQDYDVTLVYPERLSFAEQVRIFANAELVIGNCGANLTNAVFAPRGVTIFALTTEVMSDDFFWDLARVKSGRYFALHGKAIAPEPDMNSDFRIDPVRFRTFLEERVLS